MTFAYEGDNRPNPFPLGWFVIEATDRLGKNQLISKKWMGKEVIAWRDQSGEVCVADAFCPHLGANLGPKAGGILREGRLVCPFHGFEYDISGKCVKATAGPPPPSARLSRYEVQEVNGFIFAYHDPSGKSPHWHLPEVSKNGWDGRAITKLRVRSHPQFTSENSVDYAHLGFLHGYRDLKQLRPTKIEGPFLTAYYAFNKRMIPRMLRAITLQLEIEISLWGLGASAVLSHPHNSDAEVRQWVLATPVEGDEIDIWLAGDLEHLPAFPGINLLPMSLVRRLTSKFLVSEIVNEVKLDTKIWEAQKYQPKPVLCQADRDIFRFRRYCEQFYPQSSSQELRVASL